MVTWKPESLESIEEEGFSSDVKYKVNKNQCMEKTDIYVKAFLFKTSSGLL